MRLSQQINFWQIAGCWRSLGMCLLGAVLFDRHEAEQIQDHKLRSTDTSKLLIPCAPDVPSSA